MIYTTADHPLTDSDGSLVFSDNNIDNDGVLLAVSVDARARSEIVAIAASDNISCLAPAKRLECVLTADRVSIHCSRLRRVT